MWLGSLYFIVVRSASCWCPGTSTKHETRSPEAIMWLPEVDLDSRVVGIIKDVPLALSAKGMALRIVSANENS